MCDYLTICFNTILLYLYIIMIFRQSECTQNKICPIHIHWDWQCMRNNCIVVWNWTATQQYLWKKGTRHMRALLNVLFTITMQTSGVTTYNSGFTDLKSHFYDRHGLFWISYRFEHHFYGWVIVGLLWHSLPLLCILFRLCLLNQMMMCTFLYHLSVS